jgi:hypothetical protein
VRIYAVEADDTVALNGDREVWFRVLANRNLDWAEVKASLSDEQRELYHKCDQKPRAWHISGSIEYDEEPDFEGYAYEDWYVFRRVME